MPVQTASTMLNSKSRRLATSTMPFCNSRPDDPSRHIGTFVFSTGVRKPSPVNMFESRSSDDGSGNGLCNKPRLPNSSEICLWRSANS